MTPVTNHLDVLTGVRTIPYSPAMQISGKELRVERATADVTVTALAARMGLSRQSVWVLERSAIVSPERAAQYRRALRDVIEISKVGVA